MRSITITRISRLWPFFRSRRRYVKVQHFVQSELNMTLCSIFMRPWQMVVLDVVSFVTAIGHVRVLGIIKPRGPLQRLLSCCSGGSWGWAHGLCLLPRDFQMINQEMACGPLQDSSKFVDLVQSLCTKTLLLGGSERCKRPGQPFFQYPVSRRLSGTTYGHRKLRRLKNLIISDAHRFYCCS